MSQSVKLPDSVYQAAKAEAEQRDTSLGHVIDTWRIKASYQDDHRLANAEPEHQPTDAGEIEVTIDNDD